MNFKQFLQSEKNRFFDNPIEFIMSQVHDLFILGILVMGVGGATGLIA